MPVDSINAASASASAYASYMPMNATSSPAAPGINLGDASGMTLPMDTVELGSSTSFSMTYTATSGQAGSAQGASGQGQSQGADSDMVKMIIALLMLAMMSGDSKAMDSVLQLLSGKSDGQSGDAASIQSMSMSMSMSSSSYMSMGSSDATASAPVGANVDMAA